MILQSAFNGANMESGNRQQRKTALRPDEPDLQLCRRGESADPRLVELVRLLARRAARQAFEEQMKGRRVPRS
jgi:hypothetical protein